MTTLQTIGTIIGIVVVIGGFIANAAISFYKSNRALNMANELDMRMTKIETSIAEYFGRFDERTKQLQQSIKRILDKLE